MNEGNNGGGASATTAGANRQRRKTPWALIVVAVLFVVAPFLTWYGTWFGRGLSDEKIEEYLKDTGNARHVQHALSQVAERLEKGERSAERWAPLVIKTANSPHPDVRMTAAWVMGIEHKRGDYRETLLRLVEDPEPIVRRNAALALVRFGDARCRPELLKMLRPTTVVSPVSGMALTVLSEGSHVRRDSLLARIRVEDGKVEDVRAQLPGKIGKVSVREGEQVSAGAELFTLLPDPEHVRDALIGLAYFGRPEDLTEIDAFTAGAEGMPEDVKKQAALTAEAVRRQWTLAK